MSSVFVVEEVDHYEHNRTTMRHVCADMDVVRAVTGITDGWRKGTDDVWEVVDPDDKLSSWRATPRPVLTDSTCMVTADHHSDDIVSVFHGYNEPAIGCGFHAHNFQRELFAAHTEIVRERA